MSLPDKNRSTSKGGHNAPNPEEAGPALSEAELTALTEFAGRLAEICGVVLDNVLSRSATVKDAALAPATYEGILAEFSETPHLALEVRTAVSEAEAYLSALLCPLEQAGQVLGTELSPEALADDAAAAQHLAAVSKTVSEIADLVSLMLFTDTPQKAEIAVAEARFNSPEETVGILQDVSGGEEPFRLDYTLEVDGAVARLTHVLPRSLLHALAGLLTAGEEAAPEDAGAAGSAAGPAPFTAQAARDAGEPVSVHPAQFTAFAPSAGEQREDGLGLDLILDVTLRVTVELGRTTMTVQDVLQLGPGSVVELDRVAGEAVDILVNGRLIAKGEVVVVDENFGVRVTEIVSPRTRAAALR
ncbi:MAG TPA: flagellar motor switch protein FliN [Dehalococcoidia bacterium]